MIVFTLKKIHFQNNKKNFNETIKHFKILLLPAMLPERCRNSRLLVHIAAKIFWSHYRDFSQNKQYLLAITRAWARFHEAIVRRVINEIFRDILRQLLENQKPCEWIKFNWKCLLKSSTWSCWRDGHKIAQHSNDNFLEIVIEQLNKKLSADNANRWCSICFQQAKMPQVKFGKCCWKSNQCWSIIAAMLL